MSKTWMLLALLGLMLPAAPVVAQEEEEEEEEVVSVQDEEADEDEEEEEADDKRLKAGLFRALRLRGIGPALNSGRVGDFAVNPEKPHEYFVAVCSGGVWKTTNNGTTYTPIFDGEGSYSIGCLAMDPANPNVVWVGTGENNSQRSVSFGDGVYVTRDGGKSWKNVGLKESEHIGMIAIDPRDSNVVYVAAQGPLWRSGGDRGLYKTTDGGETWERILHVSDDTGVNEVHLDPRNPDVLYASTYQRRRRVWTLINGGPESGIQKSTDGGATWTKLRSGIPGGDKGRIGLDISPANPDIVYAIIEAQGEAGGVFRSTDRGATWSRRSSYMTSSPQYYNEIVCDPVNPDRLYALDTLLHRSDDGGSTFTVVPRRGRHVDDHALWIDPDDTTHLLVGCDGGIYESWDAGDNWQYKPNLPVTQFYRVAVDNSLPFYYVYGGTQDNNTLGGPSRTIDPRGISNEEWFVTVGGDGFEPQIDPIDPNIVYSQWQHGGLVRYDRRSGEEVDIKPREKPGEDGYKWNWDSPLIISPHDHRRLYFGANILFRSDDRGDSWRAVSGDLTRQLDRNQLEVMGRIQPVDAVSKHRSTSMYGNLVALSESPVVEGLIYVGTDDGLIQVTEDGGEHWRKIESFPGVPELTYVSGITASMHDADTVYAVFDNHKSGDFTPYVLESTDRGETWASNAGDLPERHVVYSIQEDHEKADLLFVGTEFGVFFTLDGGAAWFELSSGIPTIAVRDVDIQRRENDLVLATFGRGFFILDDYSPLRHVSEEVLEENEAIIFPVKDALRYVQAGRGRGSQGASYYTAPNPSYGAVFTYYARDAIETLKDQRKKREREAKKNDETPPYPTTEELRAEAEERVPRRLLVIRDEDGNLVRRLSASSGKGMHRTSWDLRGTSSRPVGGGGGRFFGGGGALVEPGVYTVTLVREAEGELTALAGPERFEVVPLGRNTFAARNHDEVAAFKRKTARLQGAVLGASRALGEAQSRVDALREAFAMTPDAEPDLLKGVNDLDDRLRALRIELQGDSFKRGFEEPVPPSISSHVRVMTGSWNLTSPPTQTQRDAYAYAAEAFGPVLEKLRAIIEEELPALEKQFDEAGAPWTPGRVPRWEKE